ncbi:hypothetical protein HELRODRAFT_180386 [Helobdella robusta]|uniref:Uncharacterized protein n=1 Tax=Helobdella robusta TaxID=6412 RepID=T1FFV3_HELRO|nr:hypothetical protein HELRODRAFT_180386 [Helobdella robusta]ESN93971.1 hypothetical protein HELRODRAFT_180386 [Helobdella robusta]
MSRFNSCQEKIVCDFPGSKLFIRMHEYIYTRNLYCDIRDDEDLLSTLDELKMKMHDNMMEVFQERTCREWLEDNIRALYLQMSQQYSLMMQYLVENGATGPESPKPPSLLH